MRLRILLVTDSYPPQIGGANRSTQTLAHRLSGRGHSVCVATAWQRGLTRFEREDEVEVHRIRDLTGRVPWISADPYVHIPPPFPDPEATWRLRRLTRRFRPDIVHAYGWLGHSAVAALSGTSVPLLISARSYGNVCPKGTLVHRDGICSGPAAGKCLACAGDFYGPAKGAVAVAGLSVMRPWLRRRVDGVHSVSRHVDMVMRRDLRPRHALMEVINNFREDVSDEPVDEGVLATLPAQPFILYVGGLRLVKGIDDLLDAYGRLQDPPPLVLAGMPAPDTPPLPPGVQVLRNVPFPTVMAMWERALFGVFPSRWAEPFGNVVYEAMSKGKTVIGTRPGGQEDIIEDGVSGLLVPSGDSAALARAMRRLIDDDQLRGRLELRARERAALFTPERIVPRIEALYFRLVKERPRH